MTLLSKPKHLLNSGFTLIEMVVVILIISIVFASATIMLIPDRRGDQLAEESQRFLALLEMAHEQAILRSEEWAVQIEPDQFQFIVLYDNEWVPLEDDRTLRSRKFDEGSELIMELEGRNVDLETVEEGYKPTLLLLSSGEMSPFVATFEAKHTETRYRVSGDLLGELKWEALYE